MKKYLIFYKCANIHLPEISLAVLKLNDILTNHTVIFIIWKYSCQPCKFFRISWLSHERTVNMKWRMNFTSSSFPEEGKYFWPCSVLYTECQ